MLWEISTPSILARPDIPFATRTDALGKRVLPWLVWGLSLPMACTPAAYWSDNQNWTRSFADEEFSSCPAPITESVGDGPMWLQIAPQHVLCGEAKSEAASVLDVLARKTRFHLVEGDYFFPTSPGTYALPVQFCAFLQDDKLLSLDATSAGELFVSQDTVLGSAYLRYRYEKTLADDDNQSWQFIWRLEGYERDFANGIRIDERIWNFPTPKMDFLLCRGGDCSESQDLRSMVACEKEDWRLERHRISYLDGHVDFDVWAEIDVWPTRSEAVRARGQHRGMEFEVTDYWDLSTRLSSPWDNARDLVVRFGTPIGETCGLLVESAYPYPDANWGTEIFALDCANNLDALALQSVTWEVVENEGPQNSVRNGSVESNP